MGKSKELSTSIKELIVTKHQRGESYADIGRQLGLARNSVYCVVQRCLSRGTAITPARKGRKRKSDERDTRKLLRLVKQNRQSTLSDITGEYNKYNDTSLSTRTVQRRLFEKSYHRRVVKKKIRIRAVNRIKRVTWARGKRLWHLTTHWKRVIFSDECKVVIGDNNRVYVWRKPGEEWLPECVCPPPQVKFSLMIWACITWNGVGTLTVVDGNINAQKYIEILDSQLWPVVAAHFPDNNYIYQDDNAPVHRARSVIDYKRQNNINSMTWPAQSPDVNIIENCWLLLKNKLKRRSAAVQNVQELEQEIRKIWTSIQPMYIRCLYTSIPKRLLKVIRSKGYITKY